MNEIDLRTVALIAIIVAAIVAAIVVNLNETKPANGSSGETDASDVTPARPNATPSNLLPIGWCMIVIGALIAFWAWFFMDITPVEYSDTVNIDAVSQRSIMNTFGFVMAAIGAVMACAGHVVNEIRRGRT